MAENHEPDDLWKHKNECLSKHILGKMICKAKLTSLSPPSS